MDCFKRFGFEAPAIRRDLTPLNGIRCRDLLLIGAEPCCEVVCAASEEQVEGLERGTFVVMVKVLGGEHVKCLY